ncbi:DUF2029 domain-containing protein [Aestuariimicrobium sp. p3-SID1156]|uniref:glycosyltransferase family 87 protein n=1 Tax=Aestuariimicrobium sp. p3-SID1156 TaxID=2916038 RepID=UPI00223B2FD8|nr:glycosyltransferase family 87 protein [Aestuariimicrobium sp. p3-SID1156]MCT1459133.1 DUF2029 domain-containing protein [Aestuariimicrobium sp. p3-SID1156]
MPETTAPEREPPEGGLTEGEVPVGGEDWSHRLVPRLAAVLLVSLVAAVAMVWLGGGTLVPWHPATTDLADIVLVERSMAQGKPVFGPEAPSDLGFTPFGALALSPLALLSLGAWQVLVTLASSFALVDVVRHAWGVHGWWIVPASVAVLALPPVLDAFLRGQVILPLLALVVADVLARAAPSAAVPRRRPRLLPQGVGVGLAAAVWLPFAWVLVALAFAGQRRRALGGFAAWVAAASVGWMVLPDQTERLVDAWSPGLAGLLAGGMALAVAVVSGRLWVARPTLALGVVLCGAAGLMASPLTWPWVGLLVLVGAVVAPRLPSRIWPPAVTR